MDKICYYGFDRIDYKIPETKNEDRNSENHFIPYNNEVDLEFYDGIVLPNSIFEVFSKDFLGSKKVDFDRDLLLDFERQVYNLLKAGKWCCFLIFKPIINKLGDTEIIHTDLRKKYLSKHEISSFNFSGSVSDLKIQNEFVEYVRKFGVTKTYFVSEKFTNSDEINTLASPYINDSATSFEINNNVFFVQFHSILKHDKNLIDLSKCLSYAILNYRKKRRIELPDWVDNLKFKSEIKIEKKINEINEEYTRLTDLLSSWKDYKLILSTSGDILRNYVIKIFTNFFNEVVNPDDNFIEDFSVSNSSGDLNYLVEVKGVNKGIKREFINQLDSHRERNDLTTETPGVLIINNQMTIVDIQKRLDTIIPDEHIKHACNLNILIIRTIDLLFLLKHLDDKKDKTTILHDLINKKGGWLKANEDNFEIINGH